MLREGGGWKGVGIGGDFMSSKLILILFWL